MTREHSIAWSGSCKMLFQAGTILSAVTHSLSPKSTKNTSYSFCGLLPKTRPRYHLEEESYRVCKTTCNSFYKGHEQLNVFKKVAWSTGLGHWSYIREVTSSGCPFLFEKNFVRYYRNKRKESGVFPGKESGISENI